MYVPVLNHSCTMVLPHPPCTKVQAPLVRQGVGEWRHRVAGQGILQPPLYTPYTMLKQNKTIEILYRSLCRLPFQRKGHEQDISNPPTKTKHKQENVKDYWEFILRLKMLLETYINLFN